MDREAIPAGQDAVATITWVIDKSGDYHHSVTLAFAIGNGTMFKMFRIRAHAKAIVDLQPRAVRFGPIVVPSSDVILQSGKIFVAKDGSRLLSVECSIGDVSVTVDGPQIVSDGSRVYDWALKGSSNMPGGRYTGYLHVAYVDGQYRRSISVPVDGAVSCSVRSSESEITFPSNLRAMQMLPPIVISSENGTPFELLAVSSDVPGLEVSAVCGTSATRHDVVVRSTALLTLGPRRLLGMVRVRTSMPGGERLQIPVLAPVVVSSSTSAVSGRGKEANDAVPSGDALE